MIRAGGVNKCGELVDEKGGCWNAFSFPALSGIGMAGYNE